MAPGTFEEILGGHASAFLARAVKWVDAGEPWPTIAAAARADTGAAVGKALGAWVAEDIASQGKPAGASQAQEMRARAAGSEKTLNEALAALSALGSSPNLSPAAAEARENLLDVMGGEADALVDALQQGFNRASGAPLVAIRRHLTLEDLSPDGAKGERVRFGRAIAPPPGLALEPLAQLRQDISRLKHYTLHEALGQGGRPLSVASSSSYFKVIRPPVSLDGDLSEFRSLSGIANGADAWADEVRDAMLVGFEERLQVRQLQALSGNVPDVRLVLRALEIERASADLKGALASDPESSVIPAEGLLALVIAAPLPTGGLTP